MTRLNYTGRKRITRDRLHIRQEDGDDGMTPVVGVVLNLDGMDLPDDADVLVEAYRQNTYMRFKVGTVGDFESVGGLSLKDFATGEAILYRIKVVGRQDSDAGKLLAAADQVRPTLPEDDANKRSLLPFRRSADLGQRLWRLDLMGEEPVVLINKQVGDWYSFASSPAFRALVYPEVLRQIADWVLEESDEDSIGPLGDWRRFIELMGKRVEDVSDDPLGRDDWLDDVVARFCRDHRFLEVYLTTVPED